MIGEHDTSLSPGQLVILDFDEPSKVKDPDTDEDQSMCEVTPLLPNLSLTGIRDATIRGSLDNPVTPAVAETTSPEFTSLLLRPQEIASRAETPEMIAGRFYARDSHGRH